MVIVVYFGVENDLYVFECYVMDKLVMEDYGFYYDFSEGRESVVDGFV